MPSMRFATLVLMGLVIAPAGLARRAVQDLRGRAVLDAGAAAERQGELVLRRSGQVNIDVDGTPRPAVAWHVEAAPEFLDTIPRELLARGANPESGSMTLVLRVAPGHPAVARIEAMLHRLFRTWSGGPGRVDGRKSSASARAMPMAHDHCMESCQIYSCDGAGDLYRIDNRAGFPADLIGNMGVTMFDIAVSADRHLYGLSGGDLYLINTCDASVTLLGPSSLATGLCADPASDGLFAGGPPIERISLPSTLPTAIGGSCCGGPPVWCGLSGDISGSRFDDHLYSTLGCAGCSGDTLVRIDPTTGSVLQEVSCLVDLITLEPISDITGITHDCTCHLYMGARDSGRIYAVWPPTGEAWGGLSSGGYSGTFGFAGVLLEQACTQPPVCDTASDPPACSSVRLHANASDPDGNPLTYTWTTPCAGVAFSPSASDPDPVVTLDAGCRTCLFDLAVDDGHGGTCSGSVEVSFADTTPPTVEATAQVACLWPPNHSLVDIGLSVVASDDCSAAGDLVLSVSAVTSDEATSTEPGAGGPGSSPDAVIDGASVKLRAERSGLGDGRVYRVTVKAVDGCGNESESVVEVSVPHDMDAGSRRRRRGNAPDDACPAIDGGERHDAAASG